MTAYVKFALTLADYLIRGLCFFLETFIGLMLLAAAIAGMVTFVYALAVTA